MQLRQFLRMYRCSENLSAEQAASLLGLEIASYRKLEGFKPENRLINSLAYVGKIASLREMTIPDFTSFILAEEHHRDGSRNLYKWEKDLISAFNRMSISKRNKVILYLNSLNDEEVDGFYELLVALIKKKSSKIKILFQILKELKDD